MIEPIFSVKVQFYGQRAQTINPAYVSITQEEYKHDILTMQIFADDSTVPAYLSGAPVNVTFGRPTSKRTFYGYVNHVKRLNKSLSTVESPEDANSTVITCVGASYFMKQAGTESWTNQTASQVVKQIAKKFNLATDIEDSKTVWPSLQMNGQSYWEFCAELAKRIGYTFYCNGVQLAFKNRPTNTKKITGNVYVYDYSKQSIYLPEFHPTLGATSIEEGLLRRRELAGVNPRTTTLTFSKQDGSTFLPLLGLKQETPRFVEIEHTPSDSQKETTARVKSLGAYNQMYLSAQAHLSGEPQVSQGSLIQILNANGSQNGLWYVCKAHHYLDRWNYTTELQLGRDSIGESKNLVVKPQIATPPHARLTNNLWTT